MRVFACMASSLDGKIGPANTQKFVAITSRHDIEHLKSLRDEANGILFGAGTFRTWPKIHKGHDQTRKSHHFILSNSLDLDINTPLFQAIDIPLTIFTQSNIGHHRFPDQVEVVLIPQASAPIIFILGHIKRCGVNALLVEGGGQVLHQFIEAQVLQELFLTITPKIIGQSNAPGLLGDQSLSNPPKIKVISSRQIGDENYLHLELKYHQQKGAVHGVSIPF